MTPYEAYRYAREYYTEHGIDLKHYQKIACEDSEEAYYFARNVPSADIEYCQEHACKEPRYAYNFGHVIPGADIEYCRKACESDEYWLNKFDKMIINKAML